MVNAQTVFDEAAQVARKMEAEGFGYPAGGINVYACTPLNEPTSNMKGGCLYWIITIDRERGVTPMFVKCGHCGGMATSRMYKVGPGLDPTHEWFRPKSADELPVGYTVESVTDHLRNGGLLLRPIRGAKWIAPTPEIRAFVEDEQRRLRRLTTPPILPGLPGGPPYRPRGSGCGA